MADQPEKSNAAINVSQLENQASSGNENTDIVLLETITPELQAIKDQEGSHFTMQRSLFVLFNFAILFVTQFFYGKKEGDDLYLGVKGE